MTGGSIWIGSEPVSSAGADLRIETGKFAGEWIVNVRASLYTAGEVKYDKCSVIPPGGTYELPNVAADIFLKKIDGHLPASATARFHLVADCMDGKTIRAESILTEPVHIDVPATPEPRPAVPLPLPSLFESADTVLVGRVESPQRLSAADRGLGVPPLQTSQERTDRACSVAVRVNRVVKARDPQIREGSAITVLWGSSSAGCANGGENFVGAGQIALWLLRSDSGTLRPVADSQASVRPLLEFSDETKR
jgi:hypothetical protein